MFEYPGSVILTEPIQPYITTDNTGTYQYRREDTTYTRKRPTNLRPEYPVSPLSRLRAATSLIGVLRHVIRAEGVGETAERAPALLLNDAARRGVSSDRGARRVGSGTAGSYRVVDQKSGETCIRADFGLTFGVRYPKQDNTTGTATFSLPPDSSVTGTCDPAVLTVTNPGKFSFTATFDKLAPLGFGKFWLKELSVQYFLLPDLFPDVSSWAVNKSQTATITHQVLFVTKYGDSYLCKNPDPVIPVQDNVTLTFTDVQLQPYGLKGDDFSTAQECSGDTTPSPPATTPSPPSEVGRFNVTDKTTGAVCLLARLGATFSIQYETNDAKTPLSVATFSLSPEATASGSCGKNSNVSVISLLDTRGVNLTAEFGVDPDGTFTVTRLTTVYTQTDTLFPDSKHPNKTQKVSSPEHILLARLGQSYRCNTHTPVKFGSMVNATFFDLKVQPFEVKNNTFGEEHICENDRPPHTTPEATTHPHTTPHPNVTTPHPNVTTPMPTTSPHPPTEGTWYVKGKDGEPCLLADAAVQLKIPYNTTGNQTRTAFIDVPRTATAGGRCGENNSSLSLHFTPGNVTLQLGFRKEGKVKTDFVLWSVGVAYNEDPVIFKNTSSPGRRVELENRTLKTFETKLGMAYKCESEVVVSVNRSVEVEFRNTTVQPFGVEGGKFGNESPKQGNYTVKGNDKQPCILANMGVQFHIKYTKTDNKQAVARFNAPTDAVASGNCGQEKSTLTLSFYQHAFNLTFEFTKAKTGSKGAESFRAETIQLSYREELQAHFPDAKDPDKVRQASNKSVHAFVTQADHSYRCLADYNLTVTAEVEILVRKVHLQPFGVQNGKFSSAHECSMDPKPSPHGNSAAIAAGVTVPLVVVAVAAAGFFLYRRRKMHGSGKTRYEPLN
ncbi:hypothetical protein Bbelb_011580 [Branchiostoma belcheri]|nr:hypothetical protein Bbelb_011580 [Branchiostoma belcheri]